MNRLDKAICVALLGLTLCGTAQAADGSAGAKSGALAGAALAISQLTAWRNNMPRALKPGQKDPGSPLIVKCELKIDGGKQAAKILYDVKLVPAGGEPQNLEGLEVSVEGQPWKGDVRPGQTAYVEFYSKGSSTLAPGTKAKLVLKLTSLNDHLTLEEETTIERVD